MTVTYDEQLGNYSGAQFYDVQLTDRQALHVNLAGGDAVLSATELENAAAGVPAVITRTWNSQRLDKISALGRGWTLDAGRDTRVVLSSDDGSIRYYAPTGAEYVFAQNAAGGYTSPPGLGDVSVSRVPNTSTTVTYARSGTVLVFGANNSLATVTDRNGNVESYAYTGTSSADGLPMLASVTDTAGRVELVKWSV